MTSAEIHACVRKLLEEGRSDMNGADCILAEAVVDLHERLRALEGERNATGHPVTCDCDECERAYFEAHPQTEDPMPCILRRREEGE